MIKGAPVKTEARAIPGASATTEVQNNILLAAPDPADASVVLLCRSSCMILLPLELCPVVNLSLTPGGAILHQVRMNGHNSEYLPLHLLKS